MVEGLINEKGEEEEKGREDVIVVQFFAFGDKKGGGLCLVRVIGFLGDMLR